MKTKFCTGNVIKTGYGHIEIVTKADDDITNTISFDSTNCSSIHGNSSYKMKTSCWDCDINDGGGSDISCKTCHGTGSYKKLNLGMDKAILLAETVKDYITQRLTKNFDFN